MSLFRIKTRVCLKYFVNDFLWEHVFASTLPQTPLKKISFKIFVILRHLTSFSSKFKQISHKKVLKFPLLANCISNLFTQAKTLNWKTFKFVLGHYLERYYFSISMTVTGTVKKDIKSKIKFCIESFS